MFVLVLILQIGSVVSMINFSQQIELQEKVPSGALTLASDVGINNAVFSLYTKCCSGCPMGCNNTNPNSYVPQTLQNCAGNGTACQYVLACQSKQQDKCFNFFAPTRVGQPIVVQIPSDVIDSRLCGVMAGLSYGGYKLVGPVDQGGCGKGDPSMFHIIVSAYMSSRTMTAAIVIVVLICIEALVIPLCIYVVFFASRHNDPNAPHDDHNGLEHGHDHGGVLLART
jgi:hypothetical protein